MQISIKPLPTPNQALHGTMVCVNGEGILLVGKSGVGKSTLALALIMQGHQLISDDLTVLTQHGGQIIARCPPRIKNLLYTKIFGGLDIAACFGKNAVIDNYPLHTVIQIERTNLKPKETLC